MNKKKKARSQKSEKYIHKAPEKKNSRFSFRETLTWERSICRLITSWVIFTAFGLSKEGNFFDINYAQETSFSSMIGWCALIFAVLTAVKYFLRGFETDTWALMLGATVCVVNWLMDFTDSSKKFTFMLAVIVVYSLFAVYFIHKNDRLWAFFRDWKPSKKVVIIICALCGAASCAGIAIFTCLRYLTFSSPTFDFGIWVNMFHYMKETGLPLVTCERNVLLSHFAVHLSPIYYVMLPFYMIFPSPLTLQITQAVVIASGVIPVILLCRHFALSGKATVLVSFIYSFYPALTMGCAYDLHENCFLTPLLLWLFYFFEKEKYLPMYIFALATLTVKEDAAIYIIVFAVFLILSKKKFLHGGILAAVALAYFFTALSILENTAEYYAEFYKDSFANPVIDGPMVNRFDNLILNKEDGLLGAVKTALVNPGYLLTQLFTTNKADWGKIIYALQMFLPVGLIPFCTKKPSRYLLIAPILINLLTQYVYQYDIGFQYHFGITAFLIYATLLNLRDMEPPTKKTLLGIGAVACTCIYIVTAVPNIVYLSDAWKNNRETYAKIEEILDTIPEDASVICTYGLLSHIADRDEIYDIDYHGTKYEKDYIIFDTRYLDYTSKIQSALNQGYTVKEEHKGLIIILEKTK